jgi:hypothetical protein
MSRIHILNLLYVVMPVALPNIFFLVFPPKNTPKSNYEKSIFFRIALLSERIGQISIFILPIFYSCDFTEIKGKILLAIMILSLVLYYIGWIRFFVNGREYSRLYSPLLSIPIPLAIFPLIYFACAAIAMKSILPGAATILLAAGHITVSYREFRRIRPSMNPIWKE